MRRDLGRGQQNNPDTLNIEVLPCAAEVGIRLLQGRRNDSRTVVRRSVRKILIGAMA